MLPNQAAALKIPLPRYFNEWINIKKAAQHFYKAPMRGMAEMLKFLGIPLQGRHHSGIDDCRNIASICLHLMHAGCTLMLTQQRK